MPAQVKIGTLIMELKAVTQAFAKPMAQARETTKKLGDDAKKAADDVKKSETQIKKAFSSIGKSAALAGGAGLAGLALITKASADLEESVMRAAAVTKGGVANYQAFKDAAIAASEGSAYSAREAGQALMYLSMAGLDSQQSVAALPATLSLATAGMIELGRAADISSDIMTAFKLSAADLSHVNDVLIGTTTASNTNLEMLADTMKYAAPTAASLGQSLETVSAAAGLLGNAGIKGSQAGTTLRMAMLRLVKPPKQAKDAIKALGLQTTDSSGQLLDFVQIIKQLENAQTLYGANSADFAAELARIFGVEAVSGIQALVSQGSEAFGKFRDELETTEGKAKAVEAAMQQTFNVQFNILKGNIENLAARVGDELIPYLKALNAVFVANAVSARQQAGSTSALSDMVAGLARGIAALVTGLGYLAKIAGVVYVILDALIGAFKILTFTIAGLVYGVTAFGYALAGNVKEAVAFEAQSIDAFRAIGRELDVMKTDWVQFYDVADRMTEMGDQVSNALERVAEQGDITTEKVNKLGEAFKYTSEQHKNLLRGLETPIGFDLAMADIALGVKPTMTQELITQQSDESAHKYKNADKMAAAERQQMEQAERDRIEGERKAQEERAKRRQRAGADAARKLKQEQEAIAKRNAEARKQIEIFEATREARQKLALATDDYAKAEYERQIKMEEIARAAMTAEEQRMAYMQASEDYLTKIAVANKKAADEAKERARADWESAQALEAQAKEAAKLAREQLLATRTQAKTEGVAAIQSKAISVGIGDNFIGQMYQGVIQDAMSGVEPITMLFKMGASWATGLIDFFTQQERMQQHLKVISQIATEGLGIPDLMDEFLKAWEPAIGAIQLVVQALQPIRDLIPELGIGQKVTQIFFNGVREFLQVVLKMAEGVAWVSKGIAYVGLKIVEIVDWIFGGINKVLAKIGLSINLDSLDKLKETMQTNYDMIGTSLDAVRDAQDALANATVESAQKIYDETKARAELEEKIREGIRNAPSGFKVERYRYGASDAANAATMGMIGRAGGVQVMGDLVVVAHDYADFTEQAQTQSFRETGTKKRAYRGSKRQRG